LINLTVKMKLRKKAFMFEGAMFFIVLILLTTAFITLYNKQNKFPENYWIGTRQFGLINTYQEGEKALFYIDQSAKYSVQQAIYELGQKGGHENPNCGDYFGYSLWNTETKKIDECLPSYKESFKSIFNMGLNTYLTKYPDVRILRNNYNFLLKNENNKLEIIGNAKNKLFFNIAEEDTFSFRAEEGLDIKAPEKIETCILDATYKEKKQKKIVETAKKYQEDYSGLPYRWGGESEEEGGFDCSGFIYKVFKDSDVCGFNYRLTARHYEKFYGRKMLFDTYDAARLLPGDVMFIDWDKNGVVDHAAIYIGDDKIIHSSSKNNGIKEEKIPESYKKKLFSVKRYDSKRTTT